MINWKNTVFAGSFLMLLFAIMWLSTASRALSGAYMMMATESPQHTTDEPLQSATDEQDVRKGPFPMPISGKNYEIFQPLYDMDSSEKAEQLLASPKDFLKTFETRIAWVDGMVTKAAPLNALSTEEHAVFMYTEMIKSFVTGSVFNQAELSVRPALHTFPFKTGALDLNKRAGGDDWTYSGDTMVGWARMDNIRDLLKDVIQNNIEGDYIETGVWRGGASVYARAVLRVLEPETTRKSYVCDSFRGLPPGEKNLDRGDKNWDNTVYLEVPSTIVANNFIKYGLLDSNVVFAKGFFNETMPPLSKHVQKFAVMRLDGDMYESTVDVLYNMYDKLSVGGFLIMDDWFGFPSRTACEDFFKVHGINPEITAIDKLSAYWKKTEEVDIQYWRYEQSKFKAEDTKA